MAHPLISVVVCTYNGERFIKEQLDSIFSQTFPNLEIVISDDASTDDTPAILEQYASRPNVRLILNKQNAGFAKNFELALRQTRGDLIAFSDQDDIFLPHKMERLYNEIGDHSLIYSDSELIDENGLRMGKKLSEVRKLQDTVDSRNFFLINAVSGHTMVVRKEVLECALPLPNGYYHDWWIGLHAANMHGVKYYDEVLSLYRQHPKTVTKTIGNKKVPSRKMRRRYHDYLHEIKWMELIMASPIEKHRAFVTRLHSLFKTKEKGYFSWPLFIFLWNHRHILFAFWRKSFMSQLVEIRKLARGEKTFDD